jgi:hypothetical protein
LNFGNGAFSTGQEYLQFVNTVAAYRPDLTILMFHQGDEEKNPPFYSNWSLRPTFTLDGDQIKARWQEFDCWRVSESALPLTLFDWGRRHSRIWGVLLQTQSSLKTDPVFQKLNGRLNALSNIIKPTTASAPTAQIDQARSQLLSKSGLTTDFGPLPGKDSIDGSYRWQLTLSLLNLFNRKCRDVGSKFMVASLPGLENRSVFQSEFRIIKALADASGFSTIDLTPSFERADNQQIDSLYLSGHLSPRGHNLVANRICREVLRR